MRIGTKSVLLEYMMRARERQVGSVHFTLEESLQLRSCNAGEWLSGLKTTSEDGLRSIAMAARIPGR
jgi:hypothetical protein